MQTTDVITYSCKKEAEMLKLFKIIKDFHLSEKDFSQMRTGKELIYAPTTQIFNLQ
jgi:hypothetical protein